MTLCECGCGKLLKTGKFARGHHKRKSVVTQRPVVAKNSPPVVATGPQPPPPHPGAFDHGIYRIAEEPIGANLYAPWELFHCVECRSATWRHDPRADMCETCAFMLLTELSETRVKYQNRTRTPYNPFES